MCRCVAYAQPACLGWIVRQFAIEVLLVRIKMKLRKQIALLSGLVLVLATPVLAQVEKTAMHTPGISCGTCAAFAEFHLRRLAGVDKVTISRANEAVVVSYKAGATFHPAGIREVLEPLGVGIAQVQINARGRVQEQGGKRFFVAGKNKFAVVATANAPKIPSGTLVLIEAVVNDRSDPMELTVMTVKPLRQ